MAWIRKAFTWVPATARSTPAPMRARVGSACRARCRPFCLWPPWRSIRRPLERQLSWRADDDLGDVDLDRLRDGVEHGLRDILGPAQALPQGGRHLFEDLIG